MRILRFALLSAFLAAPVFAQNWPLPASTPNTPTLCTASCPSGLAGKPTPGWSDPVIAFTGRFLDSAYEQDWQQWFRTGRAGRMRTNPQGTRIYFAFGQAVSAYSADTFFTRLEGHEPLVDATQIPTNPPNSGGHPAPFERYLNFDQFFYAENTGSNWLTPPADGQDRLFDFDVDDRGIVYMAYSMFGWGMAKDSGATTNGLMYPSYQETTSLDFSPRRIMWVKTSSGSYYAFIGKPSNPTLVFNVDDWQHPLPRGQFAEGFTDYARGTNRIAVITDAGEFRIYDNDSFINGGGPLVRQTMVPAGAIGGYLAIVFDGTNFWVGGTQGPTYAGVMSKYAPNGSTYTRTDFPLSGANDMCQVMSMRYRDGYIGMGVQAIAGTDQRLYNVASGTPVEIPLNQVFLHYYSSPPVGYVRAPRSIPGMVHPWVLNGKLYVVIPAVGLGDVWQLRNDTSMSVAVQGTNGGVNPNAPARNPGDIFYGDSIGFLAQASTTKPINWNFGTTKDPRNTATGSTGSVTYHQYSGLSPSDLASPLTVTATDATSGTSGSVQLQMKVPTIGFGFKNTSSSYPQRITAGSSGSPAPIVADDSFFDASDGDATGHFDEWRIDSTASQFTAATGTVPVGGCGAHTLTYIGHYGAYTSMTPSNPDFAITLQPANGVTTFTYTVQPFAPSIAYAPDASNANLVFTSTSRPAAALAGTAVSSYAWSIVNASGGVVYTGGQGSASSLSAIPSFSVPMSTFSTAGLRAQLTITLASVASVCASASPTLTAVTPSLPTVPDPTLMQSNCNSTGCTWTVASLSGTSTANWKYSWAATDQNGATLGGGMVSPTTSTTASYSPQFAKIGTYKVKVVVTNDVGNVTVTSNAYTTTANASTCATMVPDSNVFIDGRGSSCVAGSGNCTNSDAITFVVSFWNGYNQSCGAHSYSWSVDGMNGGTTQSIVKTFGVGQHTVTCTVNNGSQSVQLSQTFTVTSGVITPTCATLVAGSNVFMSFNGTSSGCSDRAGTCSPNEAIAFGINFWAGYNQTCASHTFTWYFDDGGSASGQTVSHSFATPGTHTASCTVNNGSQAVAVSNNVTVSGTPGNQCGTLPSPNVNVFLSYSGPSGCKEGSNCGAGDSIAFTVAYWGFSVPAGCTPVYSWQFDDGGTANGQSVSHTFNSIGQHAATCTITFGNQAISMSSTVNVTSNPAKPAPTVLVDVDDLGGFTYRFTPTVTSGSVSKFIWTFGDGSEVTTTSAKPVTNTYLKPGIYTVTLTAQSDGQSAVVILQVTIGSSRPHGARH